MRCKGEGGDKRGCKWGSGGENSGVVTRGGVVMDGGMVTKITHGGNKQYSSNGMIRE